MQGIQFTQTPNMSAIGSAESIKAGRRMKGIAAEDTKDYTLDTFKGIASGMNSLAVAQEQTDANEARNDYYKIVNSEGYMSSTATQQAEIWEGYQDSFKERTPAYTNAARGYISSEYNKAWEGREEEATQASLTTEYPRYIAKREEALDKGIKLTVEDYIDMTHTASTRGDKPARTNSILIGMVGESIREASVAKNMNELNQAQANQGELVQSFNSPLFSTKISKSMETKFKQIATVFDNTYKAKVTEFKNQAYGRLGANAQNGYRTSPEELRADIDLTADNQYSADKQYIELTKKHEERIEADTFHAEQTVGSRTKALPSNNTMLKEEWGNKVTNEILSSITKGDYVNFIRVGTGEVDYLKQAGEEFMVQFSTAKTSEELMPMLNKFNSIDAYPGGAIVLSNMLSNDEYTRIKEIGYALQGRPDLTPSQARDWIDGNKAKINQLGLPPDKNAMMLNYATKLWPQSDAYISNMKQLMKGNPSIGEKEMKELALRFGKLNQKDTLGNKVDVSMAPMLSSNPKVMEPKAVDTIIKTSLGDNVTNIKYMPNGVVIGKDNYGGTMTIINSNSSYNKDGMLENKGVIDRANEDTTARVLKEREEENKTLAGKYGKEERLKAEAIEQAESFVRTVIDNPEEVFTDIMMKKSQFLAEFIFNNNLKEGEGQYREVKDIVVKGVEKGIRNLLDDPVGTITDVFMKKQQALIEFIFLANLTDEDTNSTIDNITNELTVSDEQKESLLDSASTVDKPYIEAAIASNKKKVEVLDTLKTTIRQEAVSKIDISNREERLNFVKTGSNVIEDDTERAAFTAQIYAESQGIPTEENLKKYSESNIIDIFSKGRLQGKDPKELSKNPELLANTVYGGEWGAKNLGNTEKGDGWKYRGRGIIQITGKANYKRYGKIIGVDLVKYPEKALAPAISKKIALAYWNDRVKPKVKDFNNTKQITKLINGGIHGLETREKAFIIYKEHLKK